MRPWGRCVAVLVMTCYILSARGFTLDVRTLIEEFQKIEKHALGASDIQAHYDGLDYKTTPINGLDMLQKITSTLNSKFNGLITAAKNIKSAVDSNYENFPSQIPPGMEECCKATGVERRLKFLSEVDVEKACVAYASTSPADKKFPDSKIEAKMKENYQNNPSLLWQHFGSEDGTSITFPKVKVEKCTTYDPRFRPFYASSATPVPKDVVVVIDTSGSMDTDTNGRSRLSIAKEAARTVVNTLGPNDRVGMVSFSGIARTPSSSTDACFTNTLSLATDENKKVMTTFSNSLVTDQLSDFAKGLKAAFAYFKNSAISVNGEKRNKVILFLTDGTDYDGEDPLIVIRDENQILNNSVVIKTYGIGDAVSGDSNSLLKKMSDQVYNNETYGAIRRGTTTYITDPAHLRSKMGSYYSFFRSNKEDVVITVPFVDTFSKIGLIISVCVPVYGNAELLGVACADIKLADVFSTVDEYFGEGERSYAFIIDETGRTLKHPLLPLSRTIKDDLSLQDITFLERAPEAKAVIESMKRRETGNSTFESKRTVACGVVIQEGIKTESVKSHYFWGPLPQTKYSLCVVVADGDENQVLEEQTTHKDVFLYHVMRLQDPNLPVCKFFIRRATKERSTIQFNSAAFVDPSRLLDREEKQSDVYSYVNYFTRRSNSNPGFKNNVFNSVVASYFAETFWKENSLIDKFVIWRYFGTKDGFIRAYPGVELLKDYDHEIRSWWRRTIYQKGTLVLTSPYQDAWGSGYLVSLLKTIYKGSKKPHTTDDKIEGVVGSDVSLQFMNNLLLRSNAMCNTDEYSCMLIDVSGFLVMHPDFVNPLTDPNDRHIECVHIVSKEGDIAKDLIKNGVMEKKSCTEFDNQKTQYTYTVKLPVNSEEGIDKMDGPIKYEMKPVTGTNLFMIMKKSQQQTSLCCPNLPMHAPDTRRCSSIACECLCYKPVAFDSCTHHMSLSDVSETCIARTPDLTGISPPEKLDGLPVCFDRQCSSRTSEADCYKVAGCSWCIRNEDGNIFDRPCCSPKENCEFGITKYSEAEMCKSSDETETETEESKTGSLPVGAIAGGVVGGVVIIVLIVVIIIVLRHRKPRHNPQDDYLTAVPSNAERRTFDEYQVNQAFQNRDNVLHPPITNDYITTCSSSDSSIKYNSVQSDNMSMSSGAEKASPTDVKHQMSLTD